MSVETKGHPIIMTLGTQDLTVQIGQERNTIISITEPAGVQADNLPLTTWGSSFILANRLHTLTSIPAPAPCFSSFNGAYDDNPFITAGSVEGQGNTVTHQSYDENRSGNDDTSHPPKIIPVLELGAGTGLVGLTAAMLWGTCVVLTDVAGIMPGLMANIAVNAERLAAAARAANFACNNQIDGVDGADGAHARVYGGTLDWSAPETASILVPGKRRDRERPREDLKNEEIDDGAWQDEPDVVVLRANECRARIIIAADTVYSEDHPPLLIQTIIAWLSRENDARFVLVYPLRIAYLDHIRDMWERLESIGLECVEEGRDEEDNDENWDEPAPYEWCIWKWRTARVD